MKPSLLLTSLGSIFVVPLAVMDSLHAMDAPSARPFEAEYRLPAYLNRDHATLVIHPNKLDQVIQLQLSFREKDNGHVPRPPLLQRLEPGGRDIHVQIRITDWPDGEYITTIEFGDQQTLRRVLRKQSIARPPAPAVPIDVTGHETLFFDDYYLEDVVGLTRRVHPAETAGITHRMIGEYTPQGVQDGSYLSITPDGRMTAGLSYRGRRDKVPSSYVATSTDMHRWSIKQTSEPLSHDSPNKDDAYTRTRTPIRWHDPTGKKGTYTLYDPDVHGPVDLSQIHVQYTGWSSKPQSWGDVTIRPHSTYPVWRKGPREYVVLSSEPLTAGSHNTKADSIGTWKDSNDNWGGQWLSPDGKTYYFVQARLLPRSRPFSIEYDNILAERILVLWSTTDGLQWNPTYFIVPTPEDPISSQHYGVNIFTAEEGKLYIGYLRTYDAGRQQISMELAYSRDGLLWHRFPGEPKFVPNGPKWSWNYGYVGPLESDPIEYDGHVYNLLLGVNAPHVFMVTVHGSNPFAKDWMDTRWQGGRLFGPSGTITEWPLWSQFGSRETLEDWVHSVASNTFGVMRHRRNGWVSITPRRDEGTFVTKPLLAGDHLALNAKTELHGWVRVEILDLDGKEIPDYCGDNAAILRDNDVLERPLSWRGGSMKTLPDGPFRVRVTLHRAHLFAFHW